MGKKERKKQAFSFSSRFTFFGGGFFEQLKLYIESRSVQGRFFK